MGKVYKLYNGAIPVHAPPDDSCVKCLNSLASGTCTTCMAPPHGKWFHDELACIGIYDSDEPGGIPRNLASRLVQMFKYGKSSKARDFVLDVVMEGFSALMKDRPSLIGPGSRLVASPRYPDGVPSFGENLIHSLVKKGIVPDGVDLTSHVRRVRASDGYKGLGRPGREQAMQGIHELAGVDLSGKHVVIVDDVFTTGATANDLARVLKEHGSRTVNVLAIARTNTGIVHDYTFQELLSFFSMFDVNFDNAKIKAVKCKNIRIEGGCLTADVGNYRVVIDKESKTVCHDCHDFSHVRATRKAFCKHVTAFFLEIHNKMDPILSEDLLKEIFLDLPSWAFLPT